jgi:octopine/nopaline transport system permease protein
MLEQSIAMLPRLLDGMSKTLLLLAVAAVLSLPIALAMAVARLSRYRTLRYISAGYVFVFRGTPALVQLYFLYYGLSMSAMVRGSWAWDYLQNEWFCAIVALTLNTGAYQTEIFRGGLRNIPRDQMDAARSLALSSRQVFWLVRLPITFRYSLPAYGNELVLLAKATSIVSTITILDLLGMARLIYAETFDPFTPLLTAAVLYVILVWAMQWTVSRIEWWMNPHMRDQLRRTTRKVVPQVGVSAP